MSRPSDGFDLDELKEEFDWMHEFLGRMAERITHDPDVHNLADYVSKLELENETLKALSVDWELDHCPGCQNVISLQFKMDENARLRKILGKMYHLMTELCVVSVGGRRIGPARTISPSALSHLAEKLRDIGVDVEGTYEGNQKERRRLQGIVARLTAHFRAGSRFPRPRVAPLARDVRRAAEARGEGMSETKFFLLWMLWMLWGMLVLALRNRGGR